MKLRSGKILNNKCKCGKKCDLTFGKCCKCADLRKYKPMIEYRGDGIVYDNYTWAYCPKCRTAKRIYKIKLKF